MPGQYKFARWCPAAAACAAAACKSSNLHEDPIWDRAFAALKYGFACNDDERRADKLGGNPPVGEDKDVCGGVIHDALFEDDDL